MARLNSRFVFGEPVPLISELQQRAAFDFILGRLGKAPTLFGAVPILFR